MKILFFCRDASDCGGIQQTTSNLINHLVFASTIETISIVSLYNKYETSFFPFPETVRRFVLFDHSVDVRKQLMKIKKRLAVFLETNNSDIIVIQAIEYTILFPSTVLRDRVVIACEHGYYGMGHFCGVHYRGARKALRKASAVVTLTELDRHAYLEHANKNKLVVSIPNAYDSKINGTRYNTDSKTIVSCGTLIPLKQFDKAIKALVPLLQKNPGWTYEIYGDGSEKENLTNLILENGMEKQIKLKGYEKDKGVIFSDKAFLLVTSKFEGFGMVIIEAFQHELPVVSFDVNYGPREIIKDNVNGYLTNEKNLGDKIARLMDDEKLRTYFSQHCKDSLIDYSPDVVSDSWIRLFEKVLENETN